MNSEEKLEIILKYVSKHQDSDWYHFNDVMEEIEDLINNGKEALWRNVFVIE
jgi:hypothetical protein